MNPCVFCDLPIWGDHTSPILSIEPLNPVVHGHRIFIPRTHVRDAADDPAITASVFEAASIYARSEMSDFNLITSGGSFATQTVFHLHVHYVPRRVGDDLHLPWTGRAKS